MKRKPSQRLPLRAHPRSHSKLRNVRWNVQAWAAIATVLAALMSVPALIISINAYSLAEQQRQDALKQRAEDRKQREQDKSEATEAERSAFARRVTIRAISDYRKAEQTSPSATTVKQEWSFRNGNGKAVYFYLAWKQPDTQVKIYRYVLDPCSEGVISRPAKVMPGPVKSKGTGWTMMVSEVEYAWALPEIKAGYKLDATTGFFTSPVGIQDWINEAHKVTSRSSGEDSSGAGFDDAKVDSSKQGITACVA